FGGESRQAGELGSGCGLDSGQAAESLEQRPPTVRPDPADLEQFRGNRSGGSALPIVRYAEPMCFIARPLKEAQGWTAPGEPQTVLPPGEEDFLFPLGKADEGSVDNPHGAPRLHRRSELSFPAVNYDEVGHRLRFVATADQKPSDDFGNRGEIILLRNPLDLELAVFAFLGPASLEPDQRAYCVSSLIGWYVVAAHA